MPLKLFQAPNASRSNPFFSTFILGLLLSSLKEMTRFDALTHRLFGPLSSSEVDALKAELEAFDGIIGLLTLDHLINTKLRPKLAGYILEHKEAYFDFFESDAVLAEGVRLFQEEQAFTDSFEIKAMAEITQTHVVVYKHDALQKEPRAIFKEYGDSERMLVPLYRVSQPLQNTLTDIKYFYGIHSADLTLLPKRRWFPHQVRDNQAIARDMANLIKNYKDHLPKSTVYYPVIQDFFSRKIDTPSHIIAFFNEPCGIPSSSLTRREYLLQRHWHPAFEFFFVLAMVLTFPISLPLLALYAWTQKHVSFLESTEHQLLKSIDALSKEVPIDEPSADSGLTPQWGCYNNDPYASHHGDIFCFQPTQHNVNPTVRATPPAPELESVGETLPEHSSACSFDLNTTFTVDAQPEQPEAQHDPSIFVIQEGLERIAQETRILVSGMPISDSRKPIRFFFQERPPTPPIPLNSATDESVALIARDTTNRLSLLPDDKFIVGLKPSIGAFLDIQGKAALRASAPRFRGLFKLDVEKATLQKLLQYVVFGKQDEAEIILRDNPELLTKKETVTDYAGTIFYHVSPWECMLWSLDTCYMGRMMLRCIPNDERRPRIQVALLKQLKAMQGGGDDLVHLGGTISPLERSSNELAGYFSNEDALMLWNDAFYYIKKGHPAVSLTLNVIDEHQAAFNQLIGKLKRLPPNQTRKSNDAEHVLITAITGRILSRKGIRYEQPATLKTFVKLNGMPNTFADIVKFFNTEEALIFCNHRFYYANKADATITPLIPASTLSTAEITAFEPLKNTLNRMPDGTQRLPATLEEQQLINKVFAEHPAFQPTRHCNSHYNFEIIPALQSYADQLSVWDRPPRDILWLEVAYLQRRMPAHIFHHFFDPEAAFHPVPNFNFKASFKRYDALSDDYTTQPIFSGTSCHPELGFKWGLTRGPMPKAIGQNNDGDWTGLDLIALSSLYEIRKANLQQLCTYLKQALKTSPTLVDTDYSKSLH